MSQENLQSSQMDEAFRHAADAHGLAASTGVDVLHNPDAIDREWEQHGIQRTAQIEGSRMETDEGAVTTHAYQREVSAVVPTQTGVYSTGRYDLSNNRLRSAPSVRREDGKGGVYTHTFKNPEHYDRVTAPIARRAGDAVGAAAAKRALSIVETSKFKNK